MWDSPEFDFQEAPFAFSRVAVEALPNSVLVHENTDLLNLLPRLQSLSESARLALYQGQSLGEGMSSAIATLYAGHQFGYFNRQLGDGRACLVATEPNVAMTAFFPPAYQALVLDFIEHKQVQGVKDFAFHHFNLFESSTSVELQLKGSGLTPYSRSGDGKAVLRSSVREYLASEAVFCLGMPTTRALSLVHDAQTPVFREVRESAAMVMRVAPSFLRLGHLEYYGRHQHPEKLIPFIEEAFHRFFNTLEKPTECSLSLPEKVQAVLMMTSLLNAVTVAQWQAFGFCHGVMNSDNISLFGMTLDYGPYGFMDAFNMGHICNHSDYSGRYAYKQQPAIGLWNISRVIEACEALIAPEDRNTLKDQVESLFQDAFNTTFLKLYRQKLALEDRRLMPDIEFGEVLRSLLGFLHRHALDYTRFFIALPDWVNAYYAEDEALRRSIEIDEMGIHPDQEATWLYDVYAPYCPTVSDAGKLSGTSQATVSPVIVLRNYIADAMIQSAKRDEFKSVDEGFQILQTPFEDALKIHAWAGFPPDSAKEICVSCSS